MTQLPEDVKNKVTQLFNDATKRERVKELLLTLWTVPLNVGPDQLARSILILSEGKLEEIEAIFASNFYGDPRDVIVNAEIKNGKPGHYFNQSFSDN
ncbi:hypothetical protein [Pedobacter ureilyticus]|jgi:hypothetical protein|uniref:Uncharacterized protein n=1 Tax=Pedobacter ureilyticus TaxID=1393051 RepID=A0ABW9JB39_9SPHI|nr:hypothetical protein [Pedobacter helvus]